MSRQTQEGGPQVIEGERQAQPIARYESRPDAVPSHDLAHPAALDAYLRANKKHQKNWRYEEYRACGMENGQPWGVEHRSWGVGSARPSLGRPGSRQSFEAPAAQPRHDYVGDGVYDDSGFPWGVVIVIAVIVGMWLLNGGGL